MRKRIIAPAVALAALLTLGTGWAMAGFGGATLVTCNNNASPLTSAVTNASSGDTLLIHGRCVGQFTIDKNLTLVGKDYGAPLDGNNGGTVLTANDASVKLSIVNDTSSASKGGGGIVIKEGTLTLLSIVVKGSAVGGTGAG